MASILMIFPERHRLVVERQPIDGRTAISGGGTPDTRCGTPFRMHLLTEAWPSWQSTKQTYYFFISYIKVRQYFR